MRSWFTQEKMDNSMVTALNVIVPTRGCSWNRCYMCSYSLESIEEEFIPEFKRLMEKEFEKIKIFTSGSFLDEKELPEKVRTLILDIVREKNVKELTIETRPEYAQEAVKIQSFLGDINLEVAIGLESAHDRVLQYCINKGFRYTDFKKAVDLLSLNGIKVKAYLLVKPPFLSEYEAVEDAVYSAETIADSVDVISFNPVVIHKKTVLEYLWRNKEYNPPWLWSVIEVLNRTHQLNPHIICHPVALGKYRGIKNCRKCTYELGRLIQEYSLKNEEIMYECECKEEWRKEMEKL
ncbi:MAG: archaeosine biosynthesis radical SAM protein RaSEA [Theionarchaea archaeon]|nr:archaeosine biosynthesis radical SAM protein RaSEA [Theionarchaea archaeon]